MSVKKKEHIQYAESICINDNFTIQTLFIFTVQREVEKKIFCQTGQ